MRRGGAGPGVTLTVTGRVAPAALETDEAAAVGALETDEAAAVGALETTEPASAGPSGLETTEPAAGGGPVVAGVAEDEGPGSAPSIPPSLYGRFEAFELLGQGGAGVVYRARDFRLGRDVAIKLLFGADPERGAGLLREARSQARLSHENVCEVYEAGVADHVRFIVMQLIEGAPLDRAKAEMTLEAKVRVVRQAASALHAAHQLGLVHRDVKPSNIMVERGEDGAWKPYLMDFGLAREAGDSGQTATGVIAGTPAFMAPEQALGRVRALDRRTDVYGLGATLYDLVCGRPPFVAGSVLEVLEMIRTREPPPPRSLDRNVPRDLEAIVLRCLEKEPGARYPSARALGDDLERFLAGDPVAARRGALGYALLKRARRHKARAALGAAALGAALAVAGAWARGRRLAAEQATLSRELGESVKEMELFLRGAHSMPLHDVERERDVVRGRLGAIEARMAAAGEAGLGPGHYALGRGRLALQEPDAALAHFERADAAGYRSPGLDYATGVALSAVYKRALDETKRVETRALREARVAEIEARYKRPALARLRAALSGTIEAPAYAEGLIAFYEGRLDDALARAREAHARAPWLFEAKKLEGDVLFALGARHGHDAAFDYDEMTRWFGRAAEAYAAAADHGRSDPAVHEAACELFTQAMNGAFERGAPVRPSFEAATAACGRAVAASPRGAAGYVKLAWVHNCFAWRVATGELADEDPAAAIGEAVARADEAARRAPGDPFARYVAGSVWRTRALYAESRALDVSPAVDHAIDAYEQALRLDPGFLWAMNELCSSLTMRARREGLRGGDPGPSFDEAVARCDRAIELDPGFLFAKSAKIVALTERAEALVAAGRAPDAPVEEGLRLVDVAAAQSPSLRWVPFWRSSLHRIAAQHALQSGGDAAPALGRAEAGAEELERLWPSSPAAFQARGEASLARARWLAQRGDDPSASLRRAREAFARAMAASPWDVSHRAGGARVELAALRWALGKGGAAGAGFEAALAPLAPLLDVPRADPELYVLFAELHELRAAFRRRQGLPAADDIDAGLAQLDEALALDPRRRSALACRERLLGLREGGTGAPARR
ncbi:MAG TPA: serine/threonine-protein kinase [Polyangiaceae bacterium]|nr:serine/threonine-protein kinase [Polyangiaceae bacterium]